MTDQCESKICPHIGTQCISGGCEMWGMVSQKVSAEWLEARCKGIAERAAKSRWWRLWHPVNRYDSWFPDMEPIYGCTLRNRERRCIR